MAIHQSEFAKGTRDVPYPANAGQVCAARFFMTAPANLALNDILEIGVVPAGCRVLDLVLDTDDLDTGGSPAIVLDVGLMSGEVGSTDGGRACGDEFLDGVNTAQAGGVVRPTLTKAFRTGTAPVARSIGAKVMTAGATPAAGVIGLTVFYAAT